MKNLLLIFVTGLLVQNSFGSDTPDCPARPCQRGDEGFAECMKKNLQTVIDKANKGIDEVGLPKADPYYFKNLSLKQDNSAAKVEINLSNVIIKGLNNTKVVDFSDDGGDGEEMSANLRVLVPTNQISADYKVAGNILGIDANKKGSISAELDDFFYDISLKTQLCQRNGIEYFEVKDFSSDLTTGSVKLKSKSKPSGGLGGVVNVDSTLDNLVNMNGDEIINALKPAIKPVRDNILGQNVEKVLSYFPAQCFVSNIPSTDVSCSGKDIF